MIGHKDFPSRSGGVEVMVGGLARSLVERGYDVTVYNRGLEKHHNVYDVDGVHARRVFTLQKPALNATIYSFLATFDALFRGFDVIHYHAIGPSVPLLIAKIFGKHTVCTVHGLNWKVDKWRGFASRYMKLGERIAAKYADDLVVLSETEWNYFLQKYDRASILIPNAIRFYEKRPCNLIREKYGLKQGEYILYVGRISPEKGTMDLVEGYRKAKTGKKLVLVGPLDDSEYCRAVQQQAQYDPNIIMTDYVVGDPLKELYSNCGLFVLPSHTEGLSLSLLEGLSIGARCLVSDIPENTVVTDIYGAAFKPEDTDDLARALEREQAQLRGGRETLVRVGAYTSICMHWLPAILRRFRDEHPHIRVEIRDVGGIDSLIRVLEAGEIDLAIGSWNPEIRCDWIPLRDDPLVAVLPADLDWAGDTFPLEEYQGRRFLMPTNGFDKDILRALGDIRPEVLGNQVEDNVVLSMVEHGLGVSMLSRLVVTGARQTVRVLPLSPHASRQLGIALLSVRTAAPAVRRFVACTRKYVPAIGE